jgi:hypothetical protein
VRSQFKVSERQACQVLGQHRSTQRHIPKGRADEDRLVADMIELARQFGRYGYRRIAALLPKHWLHLQCACCRHQANVPVATFIANGLQTIVQIKNKSRCFHCGRRGKVELVIYFRNAVDVELGKSISATV